MTRETQMRWVVGCHMRVGHGEPDGADAVGTDADRSSGDNAPDVSLGRRLGRIASDALAAANGAHDGG
jgi:hypothetical protein